VPRFLSIDWDPPKLNVLGVQTGKGKARVEQSLAFPLAHELTPATAAELGRALKDALGQAGLPSSPVLFSVGRDKIILKELSIPYVPAHEEPTVVRFQAAKEMTEAATDCVLDYARLTTPKAGQPTLVQVVIVRKAIVQAVTALCQAAGLKLHAIVPRPFALAGVLDRKTPATIPMTRGLLVPTGTDEADFCVYSADRLMWARTFSVDPGLAGEVQKNLMLLATQKSDLPEVQKIETAGIVALGLLRVPKEPLEAWRDNDVQPQNPVAFLGALGLAEIAAKSLPVNLAAPKEAKPVVDNFQRRKKYATIAAAILLPLFLGGWYWNKSQKEARIQELEETKIENDERWKKLEPERIDVAAVKDWEDSTISWVDELWDLAARLPHEEGLRITHLSAAPQPRNAATGIYTGVIDLRGIMKDSSQVSEVRKFADAMQQEKKFLRVTGPQYAGLTFNFKIEVARRPAAKYTTELKVPPRRPGSTSDQTEILPPPNEGGDGDDDEQ
jgi:hypothetical protein